MDPRHSRRTERPGVWKQVPILPTLELERSDLEQERCLYGLERVLSGSTKNDAR